MDIAFMRYPSYNQQTMKFSAQSAPSALLMNGKPAHVLNPWHIIVDTDEETITVRKRNSYLIGVDENIIAFRFIRSIKIDQHLLGSDIHIKAVGGTVSAYYIPKADSKKIKQMLMNYNKAKKGNRIVFS
jgi:hypothetical protein